MNAPLQKSVFRYRTVLHVVTGHWKTSISSMQILNLQHHVEASTWIMSFSVHYKLCSEHNSVYIKN